jgi:hypothetical protein
MHSRVRNALFREPSGRPETLVMFSGAVVLSSLAGYAYVAGGTTLIWSLAMAVGFALSGVAEALPAGRRRTAGGLRIAAIVLVLSLIGGVALAPGYIV